jgi:hypothetical protein
MDLRSPVPPDIRPSGRLLGIQAAAGRSLAREAGFEVERLWTDRERLFNVQYLTR